MRKAAKLITEEVLSYFVYDESSPSCLRWKETRRAATSEHFLLGRIVVRAGDVAGHLRKDGYWAVKLFSESIKIHRIVYCLHNGVEGFEDVIIDHENGDTSDNKISNLKPSSDYKNGKNKRKYKSNSTGVTGIHVNEKCPGIFYYVATWREADKTIRAKSFNINKLGDAEAFRLACECRNAAIERLKSEGVQYTERHGK